MTDKNIQMSQRNATNDGWDNLHPKTKAANVTMADASTVEDKVMSHLADYVYQTAGGTATAITLTGVVLEDGHPKTFVALANNNGAATTINTKPLYKPGTTTAPNLVAGKAYTVWYNVAGACFFIKASAEGDAVAGDVLAGKKFSNDSDTGLTGTLALVGTAAIADVVSGKTFYNTDPKSILTGTNTNKKWASGHTVESVGKVTVTGLTFTPSILLMKSAYSFYDIVVKSTNPALDLFMYFYNGWGSDVGDVGNIFSVGGFSVDARASSGYGHDWIAIE